MNHRPETLLRSFQHAFSGLWQALRTQRNARIHLALAIVAILLGLVLGLDPGSWAIIALTIGVVFLAELLNTALEATIDMVVEDYRPQAKLAKDLAAGAVLVSAIMAVTVGLLVLGPPLLARLGW
jgi:diacylglycerol kinase